MGLECNCCSIVVQLLFNSCAGSLGIEGSFRPRGFESAVVVRAL